jgi:hypothetical protein
VLIGARSHLYALRGADVSADGETARTPQTASMAHYQTRARGNGAFPVPIYARNAAFCIHIVKSRPNTLTHAHTRTHAKGKIALT